MQDAADWMRNLTTSGEEYCAATIRRVSPFIRRLKSLGLWRWRGEEESKGGWREVERKKGRKGERKGGRKGERKGERKGGRKGESKIRVEGWAEKEKEDEEKQGEGVEGREGEV